MANHDLREVLRSRLGPWRCAIGRHSTQVMGARMSFSKILAVSLAAGVGLITVVVAALLLGIVIGPVTRAVGLPGDFTTLIALVAGGAVAAYLLPSGWYLASPLVGLLATLIFQALIPTEPVYVAAVGQSVTLRLGVLTWLEGILLPAAGGYLCQLWIKRRHQGRE